MSEKIFGKYFVSNLLTNRNIGCITKRLVNEPINQLVKKTILWILTNLQSKHKR
jgi:hypothetical protein